MQLNPIRLAKRIARRIIGRPIVGRSILIYHRVAEADFDPWNIAITPYEFERQLTKLRSKTVLPLREFAKLHKRKRLPRNAVAITFDDGYACNALVAAPMLDAFKYPATFFVVSDPVARSEEFWWDELEFIVRAQKFDYGVARQLLASRSGNSGLAGPADESVRQLATYLLLWTLLRDLPAAERRQYFYDLRGRMGLGNGIRPTHRPMTIEELRKLAANPLFEIGGHTATHPSLPRLAPDEQEREIVSGSRYLEEILGKSVRSFSYPFGDWGPSTRDIVMAAGFDCAVTGVHRKVRANDSQFELPRRQALPRNARMLEKRDILAVTG